LICSTEQPVEKQSLRIARRKAEYEKADLKTTGKEAK